MLNSDSEQDIPAENHQINITPFIDVVLVLLIIFMVVAPLSTVQLEVDLPHSASDETPPPPAEPIIVSLSVDRQLRVNGEAFELGNLAEALAAVDGSDRHTTIVVRADKTVVYEALIHLLDSLREAGYNNVALSALASAPAD